MRVLVMLIVGWGIFYGAQDAAASPRRLSKPEPVRAAEPPVDPLAGLPALSDEERALLDAAMTKAAAETGHWAYTQTSHSGDDPGDTVARFDPSRPEDAQWDLRQLDGQVPSAREKEKWEKKRNARNDERQTLGELIDLAGARLGSVTEGKVVVEVPLREQGNRRFPPDKFRVQLVLDRAKEALIGVDVDVREAFRVMGVIKIVGGALKVTYADVDPDYPPQAVSVQGGGEGKILFVKVDGSFAVTRADFARVEPYSNRYDVEVGELKVLDF